MNHINSKIYQNICFSDYNKCIWMNLGNVGKFSEKYKKCRIYLNKCIKKNHKKDKSTLPNDSGFKDD